MKKFIRVYEENSHAETSCKGLVNVDHIVMVREYNDDTRGIGGIVFYNGISGEEQGFISTGDFWDMAHKMN